MLLTGFGAVALVLAALGHYSVLAFGVSQRVRELGIRQALGADERTIFREVMLRGAWSVGTGLVLGLLGTVARSVGSLAPPRCVVLHRFVIADDC